MCNLRCRYCYSKSGEMCYGKYIELTDSKKIIDKVISNALKYPINKRVVSFLFHGGGEPTYNFHLLKKTVEYIKFECELHDIIYNLNIVTNGLFSYDKAKWLGNNFNSVTISLDGPPEINYFNRPSKNNKDVAMVVIKNAKLISDLGCKLDFNTVIAKNSIGYGKKIAQFFLNNIPNLNSITFTKYMETRDGRNDLFNVTNNEYFEIYKEAYETYGDIIRSFVGTQDRSKGYCKGKMLSTIYCHPNKNITTCNQYCDNTINNKFVIGNFNNDFSIDWIKSKDIFKTTLMEMARCTDCFAFEYCGGGCRAILDNSSNLENTWCNLVKKIVYYRMQKKIDLSDLTIEIIKDNNIIRTKYAIFK